RGVRRDAAFGIARLGAAQVRGQIQPVALRERGTRAQVDRAAQAPFTIGGIGILDDIDAADFLTGNAFEGCVLDVAACAATRGFTRGIELPTGEEDFTV